MNNIVTKRPKYHRYQNADVLLTDDILSERTMVMSGMMISMRVLM